MSNFLCTFAPRKGLKHDMTQNRMFLSHIARMIIPQSGMFNFTVSLSYMGLRWEEDFGFEFSKDLQRDMNMFYAENRRIPTPEEYKELTERHLYPYISAA